MSTLTVGELRELLADPLFVPETMVVVRSEKNGVVVDHDVIELKRALARGRSVALLKVEEE